MSQTKTEFVRATHWKNQKNWIFQMGDGTLHMVQDRSVLGFMNKNLPDGPKAHVSQAINCPICGHDQVIIRPKGLKTVSCECCKTALRICH